ncbi:MAG: restriction endonuclease subunit S [Candidatus Melainabacteria bacterium]|nr:restriction endonuclease subunit S [Candidatus Melainabacteria bacterium]
MVSNWRETTWGKEISLEYGKAIRGYQKTSGRFRVFGSNGPIGWTDSSLTNGPGVILGRKGAYRGVRFSLEPFWVIDTAYFVVPKTKLDMRWLYYAIKYYKLGEIDDGSPIPSTTRAAVYVQELAVPPLEEQRAIAGILGALDDRIESLRQTSATVQAIAAALFKSYFMDFDGVPQDEMQESELGLIPKGWRVGTFDEVIEIISGGTPKTSVAEYWSGDIPWFSIVDSPTNGQVFVLETDKKITALGLSNCSAKLLPEMTTIISARGTVGKVALTGMPMAINQSCYGLRTRQQGGEAFVYFSTLRFVEHLQRIAHGAVFDTITRDSFKQVVACLPTDEAVVRFGEIAGSMIHRIRTSGQLAATLAALRDSLLPRLISGQLRVKL